MSRFVNPVPQFYLNNGDIASAGKLYFYETGTTTKKDTFSDFPQSIKNTNPVILSGEGRCPNVFGEGRYTVVFKDANDIEQWTRDDVELSVEVGQYADWSPILTYRINDIVRGSDGDYYRSITSTNTGNDPISSPSQWEELAFLTYWNTNVSYSIDDLVVLSGIMYRALTANSAKDPRDNPSDWSPDTQPNFSPYNSGYTYSKDQAVFYSGAYYRSITSTNKGNQPHTSTSNWERIAFIGKWNTNQTYNTDDIVEYSGILYRSTINGNIGDQPDISASWAELSASKDSVRVSVAGDFNAGSELVITKIGDTVTLSAANQWLHSSSSSPNSGSGGVIPARFMPNGGGGLSSTIIHDSVYSFGSGSPGVIRRVRILGNGAINLSYMDTSGAPISQTSGGPPFTISYALANLIT